MSTQASAYRSACTCARVAWEAGGTGTAGAGPGVVTRLRVRRAWPRVHQRRCDRRVNPRRAFWGGTTALTHRCERSTDTAQPVCPYARGRVRWMRNCHALVGLSALSCVRRAAVGHPATYPFQLTGKIEPATQTRLAVPPCAQIYARFMWGLRLAPRRAGWHRHKRGARAGNCCHGRCRRARRGAPTPQEGEA